MYQYVGLPSAEMPRLNFLHLRDFRHQLFQQTYRIIGRKEFYQVLSGEIPPPVDSIVLTFDGGLSDHYNHVF